MKKILLSFLILFLGYYSNAQDVPKNTKPNSCYLKVFSEKNGIEWEEVNCNIIETDEFKSKCEIDKKNLKLFQKKLQDLGFLKEVNGEIDHNFEKGYSQYKKYLKKKKKENAKNRES